MDKPGHLWCVLSLNSATHSQSGPLEFRDQVRGALHKYTKAIYADLGPRTTYPYAIQNHGIRVAVVALRVDSAGELMILLMFPSSPLVLFSPQWK